MAAVLLPSKIKRQKIMDTAIQTNKTSRRRVSDLFFILWAGGAALLSYSFESLYFRGGEPCLLHQLLGERIIF